MEKLELYIHIPFCVRKCGYCDFVSAPAAEEAQAAYVKALLEEIGLAAAELLPVREKGLPGYLVTTIFFGGGTPSIVDPLYIEEILSGIRRNFSLSESPEITLEANPGTLTAEKLAVYRRAGVNRLSLGLQSADDGELAMLGRIHTYREFEESYFLAREAGFQNINVDLMAALPEQTEESFKKSLRKVVSLKPEHISVYSLIIEEGTPFYEKYHKQAEAREEGSGDTAPLPTEEAERRMYYDTERLLGEAGYSRYEISNYARPDFPCRHNMGYWTGVPYLGFGISAASYIEGKRFVNTSDREAYVAALLGPDLDKEESRTKTGTDILPEKTAPAERGNSVALREIRKEEEAVTRERAMEEFMFLGLRMTEGISETEFEDRFGQPLKEIYGEALNKLEKEGLMERSSGRRRLTAAGIDVSNYVLAEFLF